MIIILSAVTNKGYIFIPANYSYEQLKEIKNNTTFFCAHCKEIVILKNGMINTPHFAHKHNTACSQSFSEGETEDHLKGKLDLYNFFRREKVQVQLEAYIPSIQQRPDILIQSNEKLIAIEFQCSKLSPSAIKNRSIGYQKQSIIPFWILRTPPNTVLPVQEIKIIRLSAFQQSFIHLHPTFGKVIITYCPQTKCFHYISNMLHIRTSTYIVKIKKLPLESQTWPVAMVKRITFEEFKEYLNIYKRQRFKHIENLYNYNRSGIQSPFLRVCYNWQVNPKNLPLFIGIPTSFAEAFQVHSVEWQLQLLDYFITLNIPLAKLTTAQCEAFLNDRPIGSTDSKRKIAAVKSYLNVLCQCSVKLNSAIYLSEINTAKMESMLYSDFLAN